MARVSFTKNLQRHLACPTVEVPGETVRTVLEAVFETNAPLRSYLLDDQGGLRQHVNIFVNDGAVRDRNGLTDPVSKDDDVFVMQALSGG
ncbi:MAG: MoaD/ThiS family protein [Pseudomonadota bacterium]